MVDRFERDNEPVLSPQDVKRLMGFLEKSFITELVQICETGFFMCYLTLYLGNVW
jgi:hypothetical protein